MSVINQTVILDKDFIGNCAISNVPERGFQILVLQVISENYLVTPYYDVSYSGKRKYIIYRGSKIYFYLRKRNEDTY